MSGSPSVHRGSARRRRCRRDDAAHPGFAGVDGIGPVGLDGIDDGIGSCSLRLAARVFFLLLTAVGLWLTFVGWVSRRTQGPVDNVSAAAR
jgi:hypothetical protein